MKAYKKNPQMMRDGALGCTPVKSVEIEETRLEEGLVLLTYPMQVKPWINRLAIRLGQKTDEVPPKKLQLDELGTSVWNLINGRRSVRQVIQEFAGKYQLHSKEAEVAVTRFLRDLGQRGIIGMKE